MAPPQAPVISSSVLVDDGRKVRLGWVANTGTSAVPVVYRVYDSSGSEICGRPVSAGEVGTAMSCDVSPPKSGSTYTLKVETAMGESVSTPTAALKPDPNSFFTTCAKVKGMPQECGTGKSWDFEWCTRQKGKSRVTEADGSLVKRVKAKKSNDCTKKRPYLTQFSVTEKKKGARTYVVALPDGNAKKVRVTVRATE